MLSKIKEFCQDTRDMNRKYKCVPLIVFAVIYIASPIDFIPELYVKFWFAYLDDMAVLIGTCILTYMEVFYNERNNNYNERVEGVYSAVRRNPVELGSRRNSDHAGDFCGDDVHGLSDNQLFAVEVTTADDKPEQSSAFDEFVFEPAPGEFIPSESAECFFEQQIIANVSGTDDCVKQVAEQSRPESFIIDNGNAIIW